jgi:mRNA interferase HigB
MTLTGIDKVDEFVRQYPRALAPFRAWKAEASKAAWKRPVDIRNRYRSADFLSNNRVIFDIGGNKYRLVVQVAYQVGMAMVVWVGTHAEYDRKKF